MTDWLALFHPPELHKGQLHLWKFQLNDAGERIEGHQTLSPDELIRSQRLLDPQKKSHFISARSHLRHLLGSYLHLPPESIQFVYNKNGKPFLMAGHRSSIFFNMSHSGSQAVIAVVADFAVGVDIEKIDSTLNFQSLASRYFNSNEKNDLKTFSAVRQRRGFYRIWTRKEAAIKLSGSGFSTSDSEDPARCCLISLFFAPGYVAAVATKTRITSIVKADLIL